LLIDGAKFLALIVVCAIGLVAFNTAAMSARERRFAEEERTKPTRSMPAGCWEMTKGDDVSLHAEISRRS
jgi:hypothetical protein